MITIADLKKFGMIPELLGRFSVISNLQPLELNDLVNILKLDSGLISEYTTLFELQGKQLSFTDDALYEIANIAIDNQIGARGLKAIIEKVMLDVMFNAPSESKKKYKIDSKFISINKNNIEKIA